MKVSFNTFRLYLAAVCLEFSEEWDDEQWNQQYINYKAWVENCAADWVSKQTVHGLYTEFAREFYVDANKDTHNYWLKI